MYPMLPRLVKRRGAPYRFSRASHDARPCGDQARFSRRSIALGSQVRTPAHVVSCCALRLNCRTQSSRAYASESIALGLRIELRQVSVAASSRISNGCHVASSGCCRLEFLRRAITILERLIRRREVLRCRLHSSATISTGMTRALVSGWSANSPAEERSHVAVLRLDRQALFDRHRAPFQRRQSRQNLVLHALAARCRVPQARPPSAPSQPSCRARPA